MGPYSPSSCCTVWVSIWCHFLCRSALYSPVAEGLWLCQHSAFPQLLFPLIPRALVAQPAGQASLRLLFQLGKQKSKEALLLWVRLAAGDLGPSRGLDLRDEVRTGVCVSAGPLPFFKVLMLPWDLPRTHVTADTSKCTSFPTHDVHFLL